MKNFIVILPHIILYKRSTDKATIEKDVNRWMTFCEPECGNKSFLENLAWLLEEFPEYRNLFYYRIGSFTSFQGKFLLYLAKRLFKPMENLYIVAPRIGPGLFIQHGFSTVICAESIGANCIINQEVTIGYRGKVGIPTIGNNVHIAVGARVLGPINIGDNTLIGANAVVIKDIPANSTVVPLPTRVISGGEPPIESGD